MTASEQRNAVAARRLRHVFTHLPQRAQDADIDDLLPFNFKRHA
jgi:hypothetical protein